MTQVPPTARWQGPTPAIDCRPHIGPLALWRCCCSWLLLPLAPLSPRPPPLPLSPLPPFSLPPPPPLPPPLPPFASTMYMVMCPRVHVSVCALCNVRTTMAQHVHMCANCHCPPWCVAWPCLRVRWGGCVCASCPMDTHVSIAVVSFLLQRRRLHRTLLYCMRCNCTCCGSPSSLECSAACSLPDDAASAAAVPTLLELLTTTEGLTCRYVGGGMGPCACEEHGSSFSKPCNRSLYRLPAGVSRPLPTSNSCNASLRSVAPWHTSAPP